MLTGAVRPGEQIPSVRSLSVQLSINPNTIQKAYSELDRRGILCSVPGRGCFISENAYAQLTEIRRKDLGRLEELARGLALAGIDKREALDAVERAYAAPAQAEASAFASPVREAGKPPEKPQAEPEG